MRKENLSLFTNRFCGVLFPISSLPGEVGTGDLGPTARRFIDFLSETGQKYWQMLPINPTGAGNSPYSSVSAFAGNPSFINLDLAAEEGFLNRAEIPAFRGLSSAQALMEKEKVLRLASSRFQKENPPGSWAEFHSFLDRESFWINDYAWFSSLKERFKQKPWAEWPEQIRARNFRFWERDLLHFLGETSFYYQFEQFLFDRQWKRFRSACEEKGISLIGDIPIFVSQDSVDVWAHQNIFDLDKQGSPIAVSGVPPDYFSKTGQLWGNPLYRWDILKESGYEWWKNRLKISAQRFSAVRLDHFIGFCRYWRIPAGEKTAVKGQWVQGPGSDFFSSILPQMPEFQIIAEDLGVAGDDVYRLRDEFHLPGMNILQFSFGGEEKFLPKNYAPNSVAYTGTHDNDTLNGWLQNGPQEEVKRALVYADSSKSDPENHWKLIQALLDSPANTAIIPMQDVLSLGSEARMNIPATTSGNWAWKLNLEDINSEVISRLRNAVQASHRKSTAQVRHSGESRNPVFHETGPRLSSG